jgi:uncharacterized protein
MKRSIIIMAKVPTPGTVKTRLASILSPEKCAGLAGAFLEDAVRKAETVCKDIILAYSSTGGRRLPAELIAPEIITVSQKGSDLGERMFHAFAYAFREKPGAAAVMIGTDSPTFPARYLELAFDALDNDAEIVLGRATDGGFYLIGLRRIFPELFENIEWSTSTVFRQMTNNIEAAGIENLYLLPEHYDVDTPDDFLRLKKEISNDANLQKLAQKTYRWLIENDE